MITGGVKMGKIKAFFLFGGFTIGKCPEYLDSLLRRNLKILVIDEITSETNNKLRVRETEDGNPYQHIFEFCFINSNDLIAIMNKVAYWADIYEIKGVYTLKEYFVEAMGLAADYLQLPSPGLRATRVCRNKLLQRLYLSEWSPDYVCVTPDLRNTISKTWDEFPAVVKPIARQASSGVVRVKNKRELIDTMSHVYSEDEVILIESCINGREYSVETLIQNGEVLFHNITEKRTNSAFGDFFVEMSHTVPATNLTDDEASNILDINSSIVHRLNVMDGITHAEFKISNENNKIYLMEIAARNPGDGILQLYRIATGAPMEEALISISLGEPTRYSLPQRYARQVYLEHNPGFLQEVSVLPSFNIDPYWYQQKLFRLPLHTGEASSPYVIREIMIDKLKGDQLSVIKQSSDRCGSFIFDVPSKHLLDDAERIIKNGIAVITTSESN